MDDDTRGRLLELAPGVYIEDDVLGVVERIQEYDENLRVQFLDPSQSESLTDPPYRVMEMCPDGIPRMVFGVWELDERVLRRLYEADTRKQDIMRRLDTVNGAAREEQKRRFREEVLAEAHDLTVSVIESNKTEYTIPAKNPDEVVVIHSHRPSRTLNRRTGTEVPDT